MEMNEARFLADIEVRADGRTLCGICVPYDSPTDIGGRFTEVFKRGAFNKTIKENMTKVKFLGMHEARSLPLGRATLLKDDASGLYGEFHVSKTRAGDEVLELVRDGALDSFSIGFSPISARDKWSSDRSYVERYEVRLHEVSVVTFPAYDGAKILALRDEQEREQAPKTMSLALARKRIETL